MFVYILLITLTLTLQQCEMMINDVEIVNLVRESIDNALAPTIISLTERQNTIESSTNKQLDNLKSLLDDIQNLISRKSGKHGVPETLPALLSCQLCGETFHELDSLDSHIRTKHPSLTCSMCDKTLRSVPDLNYHNHKHHMRVPEGATCYSDTSSQCQVACTPQTSPHDHQPVYTCCRCGYNAASPESLESHAMTHKEYTLGSTLIHCTFCSNTFKSMRDLNVHTALQHGEHLDITTADPITTDSLASSDLNSTMSSIDKRLEKQICTLCDKPLDNSEAMKVHLANQHHLSSFYSCEICQRIFPAHENVITHLKITHSLVHATTCTICDQIFVNNDDLYSHTQATHTELTDIACTTSESTFSSNNSFSFHPETSSPRIMQMDGNDSIMSDLSGTTSCSIPANASGTVSHVQDMTYNYSLNPDNQTRRLVNSAVKSPISVTYNNVRIIDNVRHSLNANIECNSGLYLTAIKPILEQITDKWSVDVGDFELTCSKVSPRKDNMGRHLVCTQLYLHIRLKDQQQSTSHNITMHFYHTKSKILIQSSSIMSPGISAGSWLVKKFIEPLVDRHIATNSHAITEVNNAIISSVTSQTQSCPHCHRSIDPTVTMVKELPLCCNKCSNMYHKKCTDRRGVKGTNWNKSPWICPICVSDSTLPPTHNQAQPIHPLSPNNQLGVQHMPGQQSALVSDAPDQEQVPAVLAPIALSGPVTPTTGLNPSVPEFTPAPIPTITEAAPNTIIRFPNNAIRQRGSNIAINNPEVEFLKTANDACRSTIVQQEAEIRRLRENLDVRNKKILQLEAQVGIATSHLSSREPDHAPINPITTAEQFRSLADSLHQVLVKLSALPELLSTKSQTVNVFTSNHKHSSGADKASQTADYLHPPLLAVTPSSDVAVSVSNDSDRSSVTMDSSTPTEEVLTCTVCNNIFKSRTLLHHHLETAHRSERDNSRNHCGNTFLTEESLGQHISSDHAIGYNRCKSCMFRCQTNTQLKDHIKECHAQEQEQTATGQPRVSVGAIPGSSGLSSNNATSL